MPRSALEDLRRTAATGPRGSLSHSRETGWSMVISGGMHAVRTDYSTNAGVTGDVDLGEGSVGHAGVHQFARHARVGGDDVVARCYHNAIATIGVRRRARDHLSGRIGVTWKLLGNSDDNVRGRLVFTWSACALDGALRANMNQARDSRLGLGRQRLVSATGKDQDPGGKGDCPKPTHVDETSRGCPAVPSPPAALRPST